MLGFVAGILTTSAFAPQLVKAIKTKRTSDISLGMLLCVTAGMSLWLAHGLTVGDPALVAANGASLGLAIPLLFLKVRNDCRGVLSRRPFGRGDSPLDTSA